MDDFIVSKDEDSFAFFGFSEVDEEHTFIGDDVHKATDPFRLSSRLDGAP